MSDKSVLQECPTRVSYKSHECPTKSVPQKWVSYKVSHTRVRKSVPQRFPKRMCPTKVSPTRVSKTNCMFVFEYVFAFGFVGSILFFSLVCCDRRFVCRCFLVFSPTKHDIATTSIHSKTNGNAKKRRSPRLQHLIVHSWSAVN